MHTTERIIVVVFVTCAAACGSSPVGEEAADGAWVGDGAATGADAAGRAAADASVIDGGGAQADAGFGAVCGSENREVKLHPLDMMIVLDVSYSMDYDRKWVSVKSALKSFVHDPQFAGLGVGLQYFPLRMQCSVGAYGTPALPIGILGGGGRQAETAQAVADSLDRQQMAGGTPTVQVLEGVTGYVKSWLGSPGNSDRRAVVVLATDGVPDDTCLAVSDGLPNSLENVLTVASKAQLDEPTVKTFVIGVGKDLNALDRIAAAGGTGHAILVDTSGDPEASFLAALTQVRRSALDCEFEVPARDSIAKDRALVRFVPDDGSGEVFFANVGDEAGCNGGHGWYLDDPGNPRFLTLCDSTCTAVTQGDTGRLFVEFACTVL
ncbi:MAG: VWA domain-containing protein [Deltaproteobacteria bacterium]|nr:VWA domain-containing protein [Deltaproteobacteria bacterium]